MDHKPTRADFLRALEAAHPGAFQAFELYALVSPAWLDPGTRISMQHDAQISPEFESLFLAFASTSRAKKSEVPGLGKSASAAAKLFTQLAGGAP